jgi:hypothetical protein
VQFLGRHLRVGCSFTEPTTRPRGRSFARRTDTVTLLPALRV